MEQKTLIQQSVHCLDFELKQSNNNSERQREKQLFYHLFIILKLTICKGFGGWNGCSQVWIYFMYALELFSEAFLARDKKYTDLRHVNYFIFYFDGKNVLKRNAIYINLYVVIIYTVFDAAWKTSSCRITVIWIWLIQLLLFNCMLFIAGNTSTVEYLLMICPISWHK